MRVLSCSLADYLDLGNEALSGLRGEGTLCVASEMETAQVRLCTFVAPKDHCWGMDIAASQICESWLDQLARQPDLLRTMKKEIRATRRKLADIALGLLPVGDDAGDQLLYGDEQNALHTFWFRSYAVPMANQEEFIALWQDYERQLGKFFLLPYSDERVNVEGVGECSSSGRDTDLLCRLFWDRHGRAGVDVQEQLDLLSQYLEDSKGRDVDGLLKPEFLLQEHVRWSTSLLPPVTSTQIVSAELFGEIWGPVGGRSVDGKTKVAILRMRLARTLQWPLGVRLLAKQIQPYAVATTKPSLVEETLLYVGQALARYPVLAR